MNDAEADRQIARIMRATFEHIDATMDANRLPRLNAEFLEGGMVVIPSATDQAMTFEDCKTWLDGFMAAQKWQVPAAQMAAFKHGLRAFAWWKDGTEWVGTCGTTLAAAVEDAEDRAAGGQTPWR